MASRCQNLSTYDGAAEKIPGLVCHVRAFPVFAEKKQESAVPCGAM